MEIVTDVDVDDNNERCFDVLLETFSEQILR